MTLTHGEDFSLELSGNALVSDYATKDGQTKVVIVAFGHIVTYSYNTGLLVN